MLLHRFLIVDCSYNAVDPEFVRTVDLLLRHLFVLGRLYLPSEMMHGPRS